MTSRINSPDTQADIDLRELLSREQKSGFVMVAGAGSGKTTSLIKALDHLKQVKAKEYLSQNKKIACITYTEVAVNEILDDIGNSELFHISTIHSFLWRIIQPFKKDMIQWIIDNLNNKITEAESRIAKKRTQERTRVKLRRDIARYEEIIPQISRLESLSYGMGSDYVNGVLGHSDILKMVPEIILNNILLRKIIAKRFPVIFIDESQDTNKNIVIALKKIYETVDVDFYLGFFGDPMQKIYMEGVGTIVPEEGWLTINKPENFRCPQEVLKTIKNIRAESDDLVQIGGRVLEVDGSPHLLDGSVNIFIYNKDSNHHSKLEYVRNYLSETCEDPLWNSNNKDIRMLVLIHRMAALRLKFDSIYSALNDNGNHSLKNGLLDGTSWVLKDFLKSILPLVEAHLRNDDYEVISILRSISPLLSAESILDSDLSQTLNNLSDDIYHISNNLRPDSQVTFRDLLAYIYDRKTINIDERFIPYLNGDYVESEQTSAINAFLNCPAKEILAYKSYIDDISPFVTQQGVKGAQFERVLLVINDDESNHNSFSYGKLFGFTSLSEKDQANLDSGNDSVTDRTRRLLYVCCSRAKKDLAIVLFVPDVEIAKAAIISKGYFEESCIHTF
ncbi:RNA helicase [Photobacterium swingsii]|uniref:DNA 3'-5' helicase II n=1 Tax=Photobacterium swingsii TaxID=680026 RepID=A0A2T3P738_9GAMM|nr:UvrD-helicase domain-containing protein [Photobacterium swingsii]PSW24455.1 RNA helicase [Photobacterium swingsii]